MVYLAIVAIAILIRFGLIWIYDRGFNDGYDACWYFEAKKREKSSK